MNGMQDAINPFNEWQSPSSLAYIDKTVQNRISAVAKQCEKSNTRPLQVSGA